MAVSEIIAIESWLYDTLNNDSDLRDLLAVTTKSPGYQQGVYSMLVPQVDPISKKSPLCPYVVYVAQDATDDVRTICGQRILSYPTYTITVWDRQNGNVSFNRIAPIINRVDELIDNQYVNDTTGIFVCNRLRSSIQMPVPESGRVDYGISHTYRFTMQL